MVNEIIHPRAEAGDVTAERGRAGAEWTSPRGVVAIHQPESFPWLGFFDKMAQADTFVLFDNVQFEKGYVQNRNRIRVSTGWAWITVPVLTKGHSTQLIREVRINNAVNWRRKIGAAVALHYASAPHFRRYRDAFLDLLDQPWELLVDFNIAVLSWLRTELGITCPMVRASDLAVGGIKSSLVLGLCQRLRASTYLSGISGRTYLDHHAFRRADTEVRFQEFHHPVYRQCYEPFVPCMSALDLLFTHGPAAGPLLLDPATVRLQEVFT